MFKTIWRLLFGVNVREYVDTHVGEYIKPPGRYFTPNAYHVIYKCYNSKRPNEIWYEAHVEKTIHKIQPDLYIHRKRIVAI